MKPPENGSLTYKDQETAERVSADLRRAHAGFLNELEELNRSSLDSLRLQMLIRRSRDDLNRS